MSDTGQRKPRLSVLRTLDILKPSYDGPNSWLWMTGLGRILVLMVMTLGTVAFEKPASPFDLIYAAICLAAVVSSIWYLIYLNLKQAIPASLTWTQMVVDFGVIAVTISITGGQGSFFTFMLVVLILEAGILLGLLQGFLFATLATVFMLFQFLLNHPQADLALAHWYNFLIQGIVFFFTAFISGHWNQRISGMKQFQREMLDNFSSGFLITNARGIVVAVNKSACQILGLTEGNVIGRHAEGVLVPESDIECPITTALRSGKDFSSYEFHARIDPETVKLLGLTSSRMHNLQDQVTGLVASFTDLTEVARMRQELQQQDRMAAIGEQLSGLAHEIRNPVTSIRGAMAEVGKHINEPKLVERLARIALLESDRLNEIVTGFLDFARDPAQRHERFEVGDLLRDVSEQLHQIFIDADNTVIVTEFPGTPCSMLGDRTKMRQVFLNLGQNAIEAMEENGTLRISLRAEPDLPMEVRFEDEGPGIAPDKVTRIFEPFYTEKEQGVGMGLAICMRIITAHDGMIQVASRPGGGTAMIVRLPVAEVPALLTKE